MSPKAEMRGNGNGNGVRRWARLHRWCGVAAVVFLIVLAVSGIALNHVQLLGLNQRYVQAGWLLDFYGIEAPPPTGSYRAGGHRVTQLGERLYLDRRELDAGGGPLAGAVQLDGVIAIAAGNRLVLATREGELIEAIEIEAPGVIEKIGRLDEAVVLRAGGLSFRSDDQLVSLSPAPGISTAGVAWSTPSPIEREHLEALRQLYRGRGITGERLLADLHSGRLFGRHGPLVMDLAGLAFLVLGFSGLILFLRRRK